MFPQRNLMSAVDLVREMSVILLFVFVTSTFIITVALWHFIIVITTLMFKMLVLHLVGDLALILFFMTV